LTAACIYSKLCSLPGYSYKASSQHYNSYVDWISVNNNVDHLSNGTSGALFGHVWS